MARGQCQDCGKETAGRGKRCHPCAAKHMWTQPKFRVERKHTWAQPGFRAKQSANARAQWKDPKFRKKQSVRARAQWANPNSNIRRAVSSPECRAKCLRAV